MSYQLNAPVGSLEAVIADNCGLKQFYNIANLMSRELNIRFTNKEDDPDVVEWHFKYKGHPLTLYYNIYSGVSIFPKTGKPNKMVTEIADFLQGKSF